MGAVSHVAARARDDGAHRGAPCGAGRWLWPLAVAALAALAWTTRGAPPHTLDWEPAQALTQPWRAWTAAWVHWSRQHLWLNLGGCAALAVLGFRAQAGLRAVTALVLAWPATHAALAVLPLMGVPPVAHYGGLSGVLHAGTAVVAVHLAAQPRSQGRDRWVGGLLLAGLLAKVVWEQPWHAPVHAAAGYDFLLAPAAHASGALAGLLAWALVRRRSATSAPATSPAPAVPTASAQPHRPR